MTLEEKDVAPACDKNRKLSPKDDGGHSAQSAGTAVFSGLTICPLKEEQKMTLKAYLYAFSMVLWIATGSDACQVL